MQSWNPIRRYGGHIILIFLAVLYVWASQQFPETSWADWGAPPPTPTLNAPPPTPFSQPTATPFPLTNLPLQTDTSLVPANKIHTYQGPQPQHNFQMYEVQRGDTPNIIADKFNIKPETILGGNPSLSDESNLLQTGATLTILPLDGVLHTIHRGETLEGIAAEYGVAIADIIAYDDNNLEFPYRLYPETQLVIPGASPRVFIWNPPELPPGQTFAVVGTGTFVWPVSGRCMTTNYWYGHPGIDIALATGSAVYAMDTGTVTYAGWAAGGYYDYGNLIVINHGNGYETFYAHLSAIDVYVGQIVYQGNYIGAVGSTGRSSGPHIHIEIRRNNFRDNPLAYLGGSVRDCT
ncbi:MAG TPA: peptidoglycan DD-metalloendopeptidase family protein [Anaerolineae bacterium]|nr:peptidoglycan DD-metalloendopeptidase family protein [Anaerolineae bacterium]